ncbi:MAG: hypothetical protein GF383_02195, partial [Candidatus Lokiarchaeota archaeon]|nr:hypothetical protein [Candidatus Lokiarchaeota archaeon]MBD3338225.1 hypothetical protein [Candidatus Lokiarchaeota archaeon]
MMTNELLIEYNQYLRDKKAEGKKIVAYMSHDNIPEEIIDAAGFIPLNLIFAGNDELMNASHDYLPPSTCSFAQSCIGLFSQKPSKFSFLDLIDYIIVSNHCVSNICAAEIISKYFSIPRINHYIPYSIGENTAKYYKIELEDFKNQLEIIKGNEITNESIFTSLKRYNAFKKEISKLNHSGVSGKKKLEILQRALLFGPTYLSEMETQNFSDSKDGAQYGENNTKDVILTGCSIFIGDYLIDLIEEGGGNIIFFDSWIGNNYFG